MLTGPIWPSQGFDIKCYINDFTEPRHSTYELMLLSNDTESDITHSIILDRANDHCECVDYSCNCNQYMNLTNYLSINDNDVDRLYFIASPRQKDMDVLILPEVIFIQLQGVYVAITNQKFSSASDEPLVEFYSIKTDNCFYDIHQNIQYQSHQ